MKKTTKKKATKKKAAPKKKKKTAKKVTPKKSADIPATYGALDLVRSELKSEITSVKLEMRAGFAKVDSRFKEMDSKFDKIDSQFKTMESRFEKLQSTNERMLALIEEQAQQNKHVLDGHKNLHDRQDRFESEIREEISDIKHVISISKSTNKDQ